MLKFFPGGNSVINILFCDVRTLRPSENNTTVPAIPFHCIQRKCQPWRPVVILLK